MYEQLRLTQLGQRGQHDPQHDLKGGLHMVVVHTENPQSHGQIHRQAAIAAVEAQRGGQVVGLRALSEGGQAQTSQHAGRD